MNPQRDQILFGGIPRTQQRGLRGFLASTGIHAAGVGLLLLAAPQIIVQSRALHLFSTTLTAPPEPAPVQERVRPRAPAPIRLAALPQRPLPPLPTPARPRVVAPKLEEAPALPKAPRPDPVLPVPTVAPAITPPVQTGVFASNSLSKSNPALPVPQAQHTGFDRAAIQAPVVPQPGAAAAPAGFDAASPNSPPAAAAAVHTGAFGQATGGDPRAAKMLAANLGRTGFDVHPTVARPAAPDPMIRHSGFDESKVVSAPVKVEAPAAPAIRPVEILDKPKPAYTAEARQRKIEGTVLLDVVFTATGEVRVLRVMRGLGYGLDENAMDAARRIRYTPATQAGSPVDQRVTLHVVFEITG
jgi:TonB family protein